MDEVYDAINDLGSAVVTTFRDDVISEADATQLAEELNRLYLEWVRLQQEYLAVIGHQDLVTVEAGALTTEVEIATPKALVSIHERGLHC